MTKTISARSDVVLFLRGMVCTNNYGTHTLQHRNNTIEVKYKKDDEDGKSRIFLDPNPTDSFWFVNKETMTNPNWGNKIASAINKVLFKTESKSKYHELCKRWSDNKEVTYYWVEGTDRFFCFEKDEETGKYKLYRDVKNFDEDDYEDAKQVAGDNYGYCREIIDDNYVLQSWDLDRIENTDVDPEEYRKSIIKYHKGEHMSRYINELPGTYHYKYFFTCPRCKKETFEWRVRKHGVMVDYFGESYCDECAPIVEAEKAAKQKKEDEERKQRMLKDPVFRKQQEELANFLPQIHRVIPQLIKADLVKEVPMEPPKDTLLFMRPCFGEDM